MKGQTSLYLEWVGRRSTVGNVSTTGDDGGKNDEDRDTIDHDPGR